jgi:hypothetical protein
MKLLLAILLIAPLFCIGQNKEERKTDTVRVMMLVCDTTNKPTHHFVNYPENALRKLDAQLVYWIYGYSIREKHNTSEGVIDAGFSICIDENGKEVSCYHDYWIHKLYLDDKKKILSFNIVVWQSKEIK